MTHTYQIIGMSCSHCVAMVKGELQKVDGVVSAEVTLQPQQAIVTMNHQITFETLQKAVANAGNYTMPKEIMSNETSEEAD